MLEADGATYAVGARRLLDAVSATFRAGEFSAVLGANGAGKSTLLRVLARQLAPQAGTVRYAGEPAQAWRGEALARVRAVLSQHVEVAFSLRVAEVVMMGRYPHFTGAPTSRDRAACHEAMQRLDVLDWADRDYLTLSGGERQRVQFARVLAQLWRDVPGSPRWLMLDEPLTFLDIRHQLEFLRLVQALLAEGDLVVVAVLHDLDLAARFADHCVLLSEGRVLADGPAATVLQPALVHRAYGVTPTVERDARGRLRLSFD